MAVLHQQNLEITDSNRVRVYRYHQPFLHDLCRHKLPIDHPRPRLQPRHRRYLGGHLIERADLQKVHRTSAPARVELDGNGLLEDLDAPLRFDMHKPSIRDEQPLEHEETYARFMPTTHAASGACTLVLSITDLHIPAHHQTNGKNLALV